MRKSAIMNPILEDEAMNCKQLPDSVLILGCGYVGTALAVELLKLGIRVGALTRNTDQAATLKALGLDEVVVCDLDSFEWHNQFKLSYTSVVNCVSSAGGGVDGYRKSYLEGQRALLEWASQRALKVIAYTSSTSVYPQFSGEWVDEESTTEPRSETSEILLAAEDLLLKSAVNCDRKYVLRLAGIYGPKRHYLVDQLRAGVGALPGRGDYYLNLIHLEDILSALIRILSTAHSGPGGVYNLSDGAPLLKEELLKSLAKKMGVQCPKFDPKLKSSRMRGKRQIANRRISNTKFVEATGWSPAYRGALDGYNAFVR